MWPSGQGPLRSPVQCATCGVLAAAGLRALNTKPRRRGDGTTLDIVSAFQSYGAYAAGLITEEQRFDIVRNSCPGGCGAMDGP